MSELTEAEREQLRETIRAWKEQPAVWVLPPDVLRCDDCGAALLTVHMFDAREQKRRCYTCAMFHTMRKQQVSTDG